jgi:hypothetical protein
MAGGGGGGIAAVVVVVANKQLDYNNTFFSNVVTGIYHLFLVYGVHRYGLQFLYRSSQSVQFVLEGLGFLPLINIAEKKLGFAITGRRTSKQASGDDHADEDHDAADDAADAAAVDFAVTQKDAELDARLTELELNWRNRLSRVLPEENGNGEMEENQNVSSFAAADLDARRLGTMQEHGEEEQRRRDSVAAVNVVEQEDLPHAFVPRIVDPSSPTIPYLNLDFPAALLASELDEEESSRFTFEEFVVEHNDGNNHPSSVLLPMGKLFSCLLVLSFWSPLSKENRVQMVERLEKLFRANPRVECFRDSTTVLQTKVWTHEYLLDDAETLFREAVAFDSHCTLQLGTWGIFMSFPGKQKCIPRSIHICVMTLRAAINKHLSKP